MCEVLTTVNELEWFLGAIIGAAAAFIASGMSSFASRRRDRDRLSVEFLKVYLKDVHGSYAAAMAGLGGQMGTSGYYEAQLVGNWFEIFAGLVLMGHANRKIVEDSGLKAEMTKFWDEAVEARKSGGAIDPTRDWPKLKEFLK